MIKQILFGSEKSSSSAGSLNSTDWKKAFRGLLVAVAGAAATVAIDFTLQWLTSVDLGQYQLVAVLVVNSGLLELARRWVKDNLPSAA